MWAIHLQCRQNWRKVRHFVESYGITACQDKHSHSPAQAGGKARSNISLPAIPALYYAGFRHQRVRPIKQLVQSQTGHTSSIRNCHQAKWQACPQGNSQIYSYGKIQPFCHGGSRLQRRETELHLRSDRSIPGVRQAANTISIGRGKTEARTCHHSRARCCVQNSQVQCLPAVVQDTGVSEPRAVDPFNGGNHHLERPGKG